MRKYFPVLVALGYCSLAQVSLSAENSVEAVIEIQRNAPDPAIDFGPLKYRGGLALTSPDQKFRGFSGLWISPDGTKLAGVERGNWVEGALAYDGAGDLVGLKISRSGPLLDANGKPLASEADKDAESLTFDGERFIVGFEGNHRLVAYRNFDSPAVDLNLPPEAIAGIPPNSGFASLATSQGAILALPESASKDVNAKEYQANKPRGWLITKNGAGFVWLRESARAVPMDLAAFPNGDLLLLEVARGPDGGAARTRVSRIPSGQISIGATLEPEELLLLPPALKGGDLMKGASIRRGKGGPLIYMVSSTAPAHLYMFELLPTQK